MTSTFCLIWLFFFVSYLTISLSFFAAALRLGLIFSSSCFINSSLFSISPSYFTLFFDSLFCDEFFFSLVFNALISLDEVRSDVLFYFFYLCSSIYLTGPSAISSDSCVLPMFCLDANLLSEGRIRLEEAFCIGVIIPSMD